MSDQVKIVEVGARDGLQNEKKTLSVADRVWLIESLVDAGLSFLEGGSFVSPKAIPQMESSDKVWESFQDRDQIDLSFLVPNRRGLDDALKAGVKSVAFFSATSDSFNQKNIGLSVEESLQNFESLAAEALQKKIRLRGYVSTVFGCPYEGAQKIDRVVEVVGRLFKMGCVEVSVGDTIGVAHPQHAKEVFSRLKSEFDISKIAAHMHDTRGMAIANIVSAFEQGVRIFDSSIGGLGGCPYATGSSGNVATEEVVYCLEGLGIQTRISIEKLLRLCQEIEHKIGRELKSKLFLSRPKQLFYS